MEDTVSATVKKEEPHILIPEMVSVKTEPVTIEPEFITVKQTPLWSITPEDTDVAIKQEPNIIQEMVTIKIELITEPPLTIKQEPCDEEGFRDISEAMCQTNSSHTQFSSTTTDKTYQQESSQYNIHRSEINTEIDIYKPHNITTHSRKRKYPYHCDFCSKRYRNKEILDNHRRAHTGAKLVCDICNKGFLRKSLIVRHMRVHTLEKPFRCNTCRKKFSQRCSLQRHEQIHLGTRHLCQICKKQFANASYLKVHVRIHTGEKPYSCNVCKKAFPVSASLKKHKQTQHRIKNTGLNK